METSATESLIQSGSAMPFILAGGDVSHASDHGLSLAEIWFVVWKRKLAISAFTLTTLVLVGAYSFLKKPVYESVAQLQYDSSQSGSLGLEDLISKKLSDGDSDVRLQTQLTILQSDKVSIQVIKDLALARRPDFAGKMAVHASTLDPRLMPPQQLDELLKYFHESTRYEVLPKTQIIEIRFRSTDPQLATDGVNTVVDDYLVRNFQSHYDGTMQVSKWLSKQMDELKANAVEAQRKLADFQKRNDILGADANDNIIIDRLQQLNEQLTQAEADRILKEARYRLSSTGNPELVAAVVPSTTLEILRTQEADLKAQSAQVESKFGRGYPRVHELNIQLDKLEQSIAEEVRNVEERLRDEYLAANNTESMVRGALEAQKQEAFRLDGNAAEFATLKHEVESSQTLSDTLQLKLKEAGVTAGLASADISIVDRGRVPARPILPKTGLYLALAFFGGLFGGLVLGFMLEALDDTITTTEQIQEWGSLPALASIPFAHASGKKLLPFPAGASAGIELVTLQSPQSSAAEAYRALRSSLMLANVDRPPKVIVVSSAFPAEGKTITSCNCAIALAQRGKRVLLVDGDMRRSSVHKIFGLDRQSGLSTLLAGVSGQECIVEPVPDLKTLWVLPAGRTPPAPAEMLASQRMTDMLKGWAAEYDHIVIDTPPMIPVTDALALAAQADAVLLVVRAGVSRRKALQRLSEMLTRINAKVVGVVLNAANLQLEYYYSGPNRYGYSYEGYGDES
jgi:succinoglycan biosynthesis transport protein ExoP